MDEGDEKIGEDEKIPEMLGAKKSQLSEWYHNVLFLADIVDIRYNIKGKASSCILLLTIYRSQKIITFETLSTDCHIIPLL